MTDKLRGQRAKEDERHSTHFIIEGRVNGFPQRGECYDLTLSVGFTEPHGARLDSIDKNRYSMNVNDYDSGTHSHAIGSGRSRSVVHYIGPLNILDLCQPRSS